MCVWWNIKQQRDWSVLWGEGQGWRVGTLREPIRAPAALWRVRRHQADNGLVMGRHLHLSFHLSVSSSPPPIPFSITETYKHTPRNTTTHTHTHTPTQRLGHFFSGDNYLTSFTDRDKKGTEGKKKKERGRQDNSLSGKLTDLMLSHVKVWFNLSRLQINLGNVGDLWAPPTDEFHQLINLHNQSNPKG